MNLGCIRLAIKTDHKLAPSLFPFQHPDPLLVSSIFLLLESPGSMNHIVQPQAGRFNFLLLPLAAPDFQAQFRPFITRVVRVKGWAWEDLTSPCQSPSSIGNQTSSSEKRRREMYWMWPHWEEEQRGPVGHSWSVHFQDPHVRVRFRERAKGTAQLSSM